MVGLAIASLGLNALGTGMSFLQAGQQRKAQEKAEREKGVMAMLLAILGIMIYVAFRFELEKNLR